MIGIPAEVQTLCLSDKPNSPRKLFGGFRRRRNARNETETELVLYEGKQKDMELWRGKTHYFREPSEYAPLIFRHDLLVRDGGRVLKDLGAP